MLGENLITANPKLKSKNNISDHIVQKNGKIIDSICNSRNQVLNLFKDKPRKTIPFFKSLQIPNVCQNI
jgi:hypothetical protein